MPLSHRAKQFSMFDALKGLKEALAAKEWQPEPKRELAPDAVEEINRLLCALRPGCAVTVVYYCRYRQEYCQLSGPVTKTDLYWRTLQIGQICVDYGDITDIILMDTQLAESG